MPCFGAQPSLRAATPRTRLFEPNGEICARTHRLDGFADGPVFRRVTQPEHAADRLRERLEIRLGVLGVIERAGRSLLQRQQIEARDIRDVHVAPDVQPRPDVARHAMLLATSIRRGNWTLVEFTPMPRP